ncbi:hypothetical protein BP6252_12471 [Coleophoma cylindrospora]|uniref:FCP1 homology domain-containing protein n=1 Tax=Coleophoma cylindrospora TaxID=1849047 RepID=A0A3D8QHB5_9HELO|nr:hypothetical protein BP6252_12471 [Coleophoma cylindrospora]
MNSLAALSARVSPSQTPAPSRSNSYGNILTTVADSTSRRSSTGDNIVPDKDDDIEDDHPEDQSTDEKTTLLDKEDTAHESPTFLWWPRSAAQSLYESIRWVLSAIVSPGVYLIACLCDESGNFAPWSQFRKLGTAIWGEKTPHTGQLVGVSSASESRQHKESNSDRNNTGRKSARNPRAFGTSGSSSSGLSSESESERDRSLSDGENSGLLKPSGRHTRSQSLQTTDEIAPARRSIRIKLHNEDNLRQRKHRKSQSTSVQSNSSGAMSTASEISPATLKSPTSPASSLSMTKYPRAPAPPRPLIPRRQPSYTLQDPLGGKLTQKTLILDLDETLIHSMAKGGRMSTGHMVEVKLNALVNAGGNTNPGPQHPILYWVNKRPHCDDFLRRICKWYNLVIFTASVQEYADPVIDWLEQERKFFSGRYYRQHCTYRHGAFIKDLSSVEPDLSKVLILDNSPLSYMFHQDNAIPIEGWINDPTDNDLMHLLPLLEALQYVTDVRAFLALRGGEDGKHMVT